MPGNDKEGVRTAVAQGLIAHMLNVGADLGAHRDDVASVRRAVLRGLRR